MKNYSFIIPHHNTPDLLLRLVDSIPQRNDIEIIVVDDNSDENKKANVTRDDVRIIFIDKDHSKGAGRARNVGMDYAIGKWILFADADDFYKPNFIEVLDKYKDEEIDILFFNTDSVDTGTLKPDKVNRAKYQQKVVNQYDGTKESEDVMRYFRYAPWCKMINHAFLRQYNFRFEEISILNDTFFALQTGHFANKIKVDKRILYTLTYTPGSITYSKVSKKKYSDSINAYRKRQELFSYIGHSEWNKMSFQGRNSQSISKYIYKLMRRHFSSGVYALFYYITHWRLIEKNANGYVEIFKELEMRRNVDRNIVL